MNRGIREIQRGIVAKPPWVEEQVDESSVVGCREIVQGEGQGNGKYKRARLINAGHAFDDADPELKMLRMICRFDFIEIGCHARFTPKAPNILNLDIFLLESRRVMSK